MEGHRIAGAGRSVASLVLPFHRQRVGAAQVLAGRHAQHPPSWWHEGSTLVMLRGTRRDMNPSYALSVAGW